MDTIRPGLCHIALFPMMLAVLSYATSAQASQQYDSGVNPSVAANSNTFTVVEVHQAGTGVGPLWYRLGHLSRELVQWGGSRQYDTGFNPAVSIAALPNGTSLTGVSTVVEVHQAAASPGPLWYRVGNPTSDTDVTWGDSHQYDNGLNPTVALTNTGTVVEVHQATAGVGPLWYRVGTASAGGTTLLWGDSHSYDNGASPSVAVFGSTVVEVHQASGDVGPLWYRVGEVSLQSMTITWGPSYSYDNGFRPSIGFDSTDVKEVHQAIKSGVGPLWTRTGTFSQGSKSINWNPDSEYDRGLHPRTTVWSGCGLSDVEVHQGQDGVGPLWYSAYLAACPGPR